MSLVSSVASTVSATNVERTVARPPSDAWLRTLVAERLGVRERELARDVSLASDLAADSLDFADLAAAMEADIGIAVPSPLLARVRTYGDLLDLADALVQERGRRAREGVALLRTRLTSVRNAAVAVLERVFWLEPYAVEILLEDAERAGEGTHLEVEVDAGTPSSVLSRVRARLARLERRGIAVDVRRGRRAA